MLICNQFLLFNCRLLNQIVPNSIAQIDKRDLNSAKKANIAAFIHAARQHLPLQPHEFFDVDNLVRLHSSLHRLGVWLTLDLSSLRAVVLSTLVHHLASKESYILSAQ